MTEPAPDVRALIEHVAKALVDAPDQVLVNEIQEDEITVLELEVAETAIGEGLAHQLHICGNFTFTFKCGAPHLKVKSRT